jgi:hypothetical protein
MKLRQDQNQTKTLQGASMQLAIDFNARDRAIERPLRKAQQSDPTFSERAKDCMLKTLAKFVQCSGEFLINECKLAGIVPHDDRAFGAPVNSLLRNHQIRRVGYCARSKGHGTQGGSIYALCEVQHGQ